MTGNTVKPLLNSCLKSTVPKQFVLCPLHPSLCKSPQFHDTHGYPNYELQYFRMKRDPSFSGVVLDIQTDQTTVSIVNHGFILRRSWLFCYSENPLIPTSNLDVSAVNFGSDDITDLCGEKLNKKNINFAANLQSKYPTFTVHESYEEVAQRVSFLRRSYFVI